MGRSDAARQTDRQTNKPTDRYTEGWMDGQRIERGKPCMTEGLSRDLKRDDADCGGDVGSIFLYPSISLTLTICLSLYLCIYVSIPTCYLAMFNLSFVFSYTFKEALSPFGDCGGNITDAENGIIKSINFPEKYTSSGKG